MRPNKGMKLTELSAAPDHGMRAVNYFCRAADLIVAAHGRLAWLVRKRRLMPAPVDGMDTGTASQLIPDVRQLSRRDRRRSGP